MSVTRLLTLIIATILTGCASNSAKNPADPLEPVNRRIYQFNDTFDKAILKPISQGYTVVMPTFGQTMVANFFANLDDVVVTANDLLQFKLTQGLADGTRFVLNSTIGVLGLFDIATMLDLKKHHEDFGQTLGKWGLASGPYIVIPFLGPSSLRDGVGLYADSYSSPLYQIQHIPTRNQAQIVKVISLRAKLLDQEKILKEAMLDPYYFIRDTYLLHRKNRVYDGNPPRASYDVEEEDDGFIFQEPSPTATPQ